MILERNVQHIHQGCWEALEALDKAYNEVETKHGFPPKRRYRMYLGGASINQLVIERDWESFAQWEKCMMEVMQDPEYQALDQKAASLIDDVHIEGYLRLG